MQNRLCQSAHIGPMSETGSPVAASFLKQGKDGNFLQSRRLEHLSHGLIDQNHIICQIPPELDFRPRPADGGTS